jgi:hypothetical protein
MTALQLTSAAMLLDRARGGASNIVGPGEMRAQLEQTFKNHDACLKAGHDLGRCC